LVTKLKSFSHSIIIKVIFFLLAVFCLTGAMKSFIDVVLSADGRLDIVFEDNYFASRSFVEETGAVLEDLADLIVKYKNEEHILQGRHITDEQLRRETYNLWMNYEFYSTRVSDEENFNRYKELYPDEVARVRDRLIKEDLKKYHSLRQRLEEYDGLLYYADDGEHVYSSSKKIDLRQLQSYPVFLAVENYRLDFHPEEIEDNNHLYRLLNRFERLELENGKVFIAFTEDFLNARIEEWKTAKGRTENGLWQVAGLLLGFLLSLVYLSVTVGRKSFEDKEVHFLPVEKIYNDVNLVLCTSIAVLWVALIEQLFDNLSQAILLITLPVVAIGLLLFLSLVKHLKKRTLLKHTLLYRTATLVYDAVSKVYASGSVGVKIILIVILYPILVAMTFYIFPVTIGIAAWLAFKQVKLFNSIKEGVERIKSGDIGHVIPVSGNGELATLAADINSIAGGLKKAVDNELRSERLKTELITNVSHDIRTPLTSIITYVDLLKKEEEPQKAREYIETLDQKAKRLKTLIDDLFEAAKASSGNIPVNIEKIDMVSLLTQGLGEVNDKIEALELDFRLSHPRDKVYVAADGKLLWRSIENLLSNIFKYALKGSRVYIDIEEQGNEILLTFKNISANELNISADELMERFTRGDESRSSEGSGLGLSIAKSLIDLQQGKFSIQIDGDLFKAMVTMPKYKT
jgi:signal transduction histidine kinase